MIKNRWMAFTAGAILLIVQGVHAGKNVQAGQKQTGWLAFDTHVTGGSGATGQWAIFDLKDPRIQGPGKCRDSLGEPHMFLGGFAFGHSDPRKKDPNAFCGHGIATPYYGPAQTTPQPLSILPIEAPMPIESGHASAADAAKMIREMLPRLDKSDGDNMPIVVQLRDSIRHIDVINGARFMPKRQAVLKEQG